MNNISRNNPSLNKHLYPPTLNSSNSRPGYSIRKNPSSRQPQVNQFKHLTSSSNPYNHFKDYGQYSSSNMRDIFRQQAKQKPTAFRINEPKKSDISLRGHLGTYDERKATIQQRLRESRNAKNTKDEYRNTKEQQVSLREPVGLVGLNNIGNTCYMNSTLQCLFNLPIFNDYFLQDRHLKQLRQNGKVTRSYEKLIKAVRNTSYRSQTPSDLKLAVASKKSRFQGYAQQDAQQFLTSLLELMSLELNRVSKPKYKELTADLTKHTLEQISEQWWKYNKEREDSWVTDCFTGQLLSRVVCGKCSNESIAFDNTWDFALNFQRYDDGEILKMIENFLGWETISSDYYCSKCKIFRQCRRKLDFYRLPNIIVFELKRFSYGKYRKLKLNNRVKIRQHLDLSSLVTESTHHSVRNPIYELVAIVNHVGDIDFGHYTAECKNPGDKRWYTFNDSSVYSSKQKQNYESSSPYLLFYAKKDFS